MRVWDGAREVPELPGSVVTIGMFDGMHRGHRDVVRRTLEQAKRLDVPSVVITFTPHPATIHRPDARVTPLTSLTQRLGGLAAAGVDAVLLIEYDLAFAATSPEEFVRHYIVDVLHANAVVIGEDSRFGSANSAGAGEMRRLGERFGFETTIVTDLCDPESGRRWSSTWVREALGEGDVASAGKVLGSPHTVRGEVVHGAKRGRELGYPTANLQPEEIGVVPRDGVYAGWLIDDESRYPAAISVGTNPQFEGVHRTVEAHVLGRRDLDLYGHVVTVEFVRWIRPMMTFDSLDGLVDRMAVDVNESADALGVDRPAPARREAREPLV